MSSLRHQPSNAHLIVPVLFLCVLALVLQSRWVNRNQDKFVDPNMVRLMQQMNPEITLRILCPACRGSGELTQAGLDGTEERIPCPLSFGLSYHEIQIAPAKQAICYTCGGMGAWLEGSPAVPVTCPTCQGRGVLQNDNPLSRMKGPIHTFIFECHHCNTEGDVYDPDLAETVECPICFGKGQRQTRAMNDVDKGCGNCGGMGRWINPDTNKAESCPRCDGLGLVTDLNNDES